MKIFLNDIKKIDWLTNCILQTNWGKTFLNITNGHFFVFNYNLNEEDSSIDIVSASQLMNINDYIYKKMEAEHVGYMREPFETKNYLFFSILKSACQTKEQQDKLIDLFVGYKSYDIAENKKNLKTYIIGSMPVNSRISFSTAISEFFLDKNPINGICMLYELIDGLSKQKIGKSIYSQLHKIVRAIKNPNGGLIPEVAGSTMRYMIVGEVALGNDTELQKAKDLFRGGNSEYEVYLETGWYLNKFDGKWRKKISDDTFSFKLDKVTQENGQYYVSDDIVNTSKQNADIAEKICDSKVSITELVANMGYKTQLGDYISYEEIFNLYPKLPSIYSFLSAKVLPSRKYSFYFSPSDPYALVLVYGKQFPFRYFEDLKYVALHEMQHYVQRIEDFGSGGNLELANILTVAGGESTKNFINSIGGLQKRFMEVCTLIPLEEYKELTDKLKEDFDIISTQRDIKLKKRINPSNQRPKAEFVEVVRIYEAILEDLIFKTRNISSIQGNSVSITYMLLTIYSLIEENVYIEKFISKYVGKDYMDLFKMSLVQTRDLILKETDMASKGWTAQDLYILNFQLYESLIGEVEARFTQQTTRMPQVLLNYFDFYTSETVDITKVGVINNSILANGGVDFVAAIETTPDEKYIIHLPDELSNSVNLLHETGHILFDLLKDKVYFDKDAILSEEYFCACFLDYIHRRNIDPMLTADLDNQRTKENLTHFDNLFEEALFLQKKEIDERGLILRLEFVTKILG